MRTEDDLHVEIIYSRPGDSWQVNVPAEAVARVLAPFLGRKRAFLVRLLNGWSKRAAATGAGVSVRTTQLWAKADGEFAESVAFCESVGFSTVIESELYRRALAGVADRGSMRALELVVKSRAPEYREKAQIQLDVIQQASEASARLVAGWQENNPTRAE